MSPAPDILSEDTIAAVATARGRGALALVRISGVRSRDVLKAICPEISSDPSFPARAPRLLRIVHPVTGDAVDKAVVTLFVAPASFTGEDCVEITTHGGLLTPELVLTAAVAAGARPAMPGEFTRRALANGKLDLLQAEAILDVIEGRSPAQHRAAIHQLERGLSDRIETLRAALIRVEALLSYGIDFPEEDEPPVRSEVVVEAGREALRQIRLMLRTAPQAAMLREGPLVVLAGRPNAGKSSLFNALVGYERSIVTELPGTTRDAVEAPVTMRGYPFRLVDTAGLRVTEDRIEGIGVEVARRYLTGADMVLYCVAGDEAMTAEDSNFLEGLESSRRLHVRTKVDIPRAVTVAGEAQEEVAVSTVTGEGLEVLVDMLVRRSFGLLDEDRGDHPLLTRERHIRALEAAAAELEWFLERFPDELPPEVAATHLQSAVSALESLIGAVVSDDVLAAIFSEFCVGK